MKLTRTRKDLTCYQCKKSIAKGEQYAKKSMTIGRPQDDAMEMIDGCPVMVCHGIRIVNKICASCAI